MTDPTPQTSGGFYGGLDAGSVRGVLPPQNKGASDTLIEEFLAEAQGRVRRAVGSLPDWDPTWTPGEVPEPHCELRGIVRDLTAARTTLKLFGAETDEGRRAGIALRDDALTRLQAFVDATPGGGGADNGSPRGRRNDDYVENFTDEAVYAPDPYGDYDYGYYDHGHASLRSRGRRP